MKRELLIFGANGALGTGVTKTLISKGYDKINLFASEFEGLPSESDSISHIKTSDLSLPENVQKAFKTVKPEKDKLLFMFSSIGGFAGGKTVWQQDDAGWNDMFDKNLKTGFLIAKEFAKIVSESAGGSICFTSAFTALKPEPRKAAYGASKAALNHLVETLNLEGEKINLSVNAIAPYIIDTPANREWMKGEEYESWSKPEEIGTLIDYLFNIFNFVGGNIISLRHRFAVEND